MVQTQKTDVLDYLAENFLNKGASVTYREFSGIPGLQVNINDQASQIYFSAEVDISHLKFLKELIFEEIFLPVFDEEEDVMLKAALAKGRNLNEKLYRFFPADSLPEPQEISK